LTVFIDLLGFGMVLPLLPIYAKQFAAQAQSPPSEAAVGLMIGLLMASFSAMQFLFAPLWGRLSDRIGRRPVLMIGLAGSMVFYALFGMATTWKSIAWLFVARLGAGIAGATIATAQAYIADSTSQQGRTKGMALIGAAFGLGFTFGPLIGAAGFLTTGAVQLSPLPGYIASGLSAGALLLAYFKLPESLTPDSRPAQQSLLDLAALRAALAVPTVGLLLLTSFITVFSFANFESTISLLLKSKTNAGGFDFDTRQVFYVFAFIGLVLSVSQGFLVRRLAGRIPDGTLAAIGAVVSMAGFVMLAFASRQGSGALLLVGLAIEVIGFSFVTPSVNALISRRSDPRRQGAILGVVQSASALARIVGPVFGNILLPISAALPYWAATALMIGGLLMILIAARGGGDFAAQDV
jgi:MFS family permease